MGKSGDGILQQLGTTSEKLDYIGGVLGGEPEPGDPSSIEEYFMKAGFSVKTLFQECQFARRNFKCDEVIMKTFNNDFGVCYLIQSKDFYQRSEGAGLSLVIDVNRHRWPYKPLLSGISVQIYQHFDPTESSALKFYVQVGGIYY